MGDNEKIPSRYKWIFDESLECSFDILNDKKLLIAKYYGEGLKKLLTIFKYNKIPKTITPRTLEMFILGGYAKIFRYNDNWYCGIGNMSGVLNYDLIPTNATIVNVNLNYSKTLINVTPFNVDEITKDNIEDYCFIIRNDELYQGLLNEVSFYATMQTECDLTLKMLLYNARIPVVSVSTSDTTKTAFDDFMSNIAQGKLATSFLGSKAFETLKTLPYDNTHLGKIKEVIECKQYYKASFENLIGLNANYNMKRESLNNDEIALNDDNLLPTIDQMNESRKKDFDLLNQVSKRLYGETVFEFELNSSWKNRQKEIQIEFKNQENENNPKADNSEVEENDEVK